MPWSNQSGGGGWKGGSGGPWGPRPGAPGQQPDLEEILRRSQDKLRQAMPGGRMGGPFAVLLAVLLAALVGFFGFTVRVNPDELGIVLRFGEYVRQLPPGLNFRWPYPIEQVGLPKVTRINRTEIGMRGSADSRDASSTIRDVPEESLMLTGDENIVDVDFVVFWRIADAPDFLFNIQNPEGTVKAVAESAMREIVGQNDIEPILTEARAKTEAAVQTLMQQVLDSYGAGVQVTQVQLQKVDPPNQVIDAFRDVQAARADQERLQNEAEAYANRIIPEARGEAERILQAAQGYRDQVIALAKGEADRFLKVYEQYQKAPEVTRKRIFIETMEKVLGDTEKVIIDGKSGPGVIPYLPLPEFSKQRSQQPATEVQPRMSRTLWTTVLVVLGVAAFVAYLTLFTVSQTQQALVLEFGKPKRVITEPGLKWKIPFIQNVEFFDKRILDVDTASQEVIASDKKRLVVDAFARYRITDPLQFFQSLRDERVASARIGAILEASLRRVLGGASFLAVVRDKREDLMRTIGGQVNQEAAPFGVKIVDVRIKRVDLPEANMQAIYRRMQTERQREASEFRAEGEGAARRIRGTADREVTVLKANATGESERIRGAGDGEKNRIFAEAFGQDPDFFSFYRSMQAYEGALKAGDTRLLLSPDSQFFQYFNDSAGSPAKPAGSPPEPGAAAPSPQPEAPPDASASDVPPQGAWSPDASGTSEREAAAGDPAPVETPSP